MDQRIERISEDSVSIGGNKWRSTRKEYGRAVIEGGSVLHRTEDDDYVANYDESECFCVQIIVIIFSLIYLSVKGALRRHPCQLKENTWSLQWNAFDTHKKKEYCGNTLYFNTRTLQYVLDDTNSYSSAYKTRAHTQTHPRRLHEHRLKLNGKPKTCSDRWFVTLQRVLDTLKAGVAINITLQSFLKRRVMRDTQPTQHASLYISHTDECVWIAQNFRYNHYTSDCLRRGASHLLK